VSPLELVPFLEAQRAAVDAALERAVRAAASHGRLSEAIGYAVRGGGKRLRPTLCVAAYRALGKEPTPAVYDLAASIELVHTYSLVHDDLPSMDDDPVRRGRPATHMAFGVPTATIAGAALIPYAVGVAARAVAELGLASETRQAVLRELCVAAGAGGMVGGQVLDLEAEGRALAVEDLERIHRHKTGALLAAAPVMGGMAGGAGAAARHALRAYGSAVGLAFQITDDILDVTGTTAVLGKTAGRDDALDKASFAAVIGVPAAQARARGQVDGALAALDAAGIRSEELAALARYAAERDR
jgi:geranylgeranyl diphosphate synthase, type II